MTPLVSLHNVSVAYNGVPALHDVNLTVYQNDFVAIAGPNGGGKSSLVKAVIGIVPFSGSIDFHGDIAPCNGSIGYLPQINNFDTSFPISVEEVVISGLQSKHKLFGRISKKDRSAALALLDKTNIKHLAHKQISQLSGGELQRVLLCRALISNPQLLILDEPANFVDDSFETTLYNILGALNNSMTIIMVSHEIEAVSGLVNRIVHIDKTILKIDELRRQ